jgi:hypothetical protein
MQEKEIRGIQIIKEGLKLSLFIDDTILYLEDRQNFNIILLDHQIFQQSRKIQSQHTKISNFSINQF